MPVAFSSVLYYPTIDIRNEQWLRNAILFWDKIYTIVPASHESPYRSQLSSELCQQEMLCPLRVSPEMEEVEDLTEIVEDFITDPATTDLLLSNGNSPHERISPDKLSHEVGSGDRDLGTAYMDLGTAYIIIDLFLFFLRLCPH